ncbi:MAG: site-specific integrase, partial [Acidimicrobiales bacterium]
RPGELFGLTVDRVDFLRRSLRVDRQLVRARGQGVELAAPKTQASYRTVPLAATVGEVLAAHLSEWPARAELGLVFTNERGAPIQQHPFAALWQDAARRAGLPGWATPHDLRHYFASVLIRSGASVKVVQARLGHSSAKTTLDVYGHLFADEEDRTRAAIDAEFAPQCAPDVHQGGSPPR